MILRPRRPGPTQGSLRVAVLALVLGLTACGSVPDSSADGGPDVDAASAPADAGIDGPPTGCEDEGCACSVAGATLPCGTDTGRCVAGRRACDGTRWGSCDGATDARTETCDGEDDDCDGATDEACPCVGASTQPCGDDTGACERGVQTCTDAGWGDCAGGVVRTEEACNGVDDDCDGATDEGGNGCGGACPLTLAPDDDCEGADADTCRDDRVVCEGPNASACSLGGDDRRIGVHRAAKTDGEYFYATDLAEAGSNGFTIEITDYFFLAVASEPIRRVPFLRCLYPSGKHAYTAHPAGCAAVPGTTLELVMGYVEVEATEDTIPLHVLRMGTELLLYTIHASERDTAVAGGWVSEGIIANVYPAVCP